MISLYDSTANAMVTILLENNIPFDRLVMRRAVRASNGVDEIVDDADADAIPRRRHRRTSVPQIGRRIETIHRVRILIAVRRIVPPSDGVEQTSNHRRPFKERKKNKKISENERKLKES